MTFFKVNTNWVLNISQFNNLNFVYFFVAIKSISLKNFRLFQISFIYIYKKLNNLFILYQMGRFYCSICDKTLFTSFRSRHNTSLKHSEVSHSVVKRYILNNIKVKDANDILDKHINDYKKKFNRFKFSCKISWIITRDYTKHILIKKRKFRPSDIFNMQITFFTKIVNMTYKHYLQQPRQTIENNRIKKTNQNPSLMKLFNSFPQPVHRYT